MPLWLVTPVHGRVGLTRLCLEQRAHLIDELAGLGVEAHQVVVGNDDNLATAREFGFHVLERPNELGRKVNDGFEYACREGGAAYVSFVGSDDWVHPSFMARRPESDARMLTSKWVAFVAPDGGRLIVNAIPGAHGNAPWIIPRALLASAAFRPVVDRKMNGIDSSIRVGLVAALKPRVAPSAPRREHRQAEALVRSRVFEHADDADELRVVDFKSAGEQITSWGLVVPRHRNRLVHDEPDPWPVLATRYPPGLVERMQKFYETGVPT